PRHDPEVGRARDLLGERAEVGGADGVDRGLVRDEAGAVEAAAHDGPVGHAVEADVVEDLAPREALAEHPRDGPTPGPARVQQRAVEVEEQEGGDHGRPRPASTSGSSTTDATRRRMPGSSRGTPWSTWTVVMPSRPAARMLSGRSSTNTQPDG